MDAAELRRSRTLLEACWRTFDAAVAAASERGTLRKGPRGGGRELDAIVRHVLDADGAYLARVGQRSAKAQAGDLPDQLSRTRREILDAMLSSARGEVPARGPRGGVRWTARYFVRRVTWHVLDHAWEIEDRTG